MAIFFEGELTAEGLSFAIVASRFHDEIVSKLLDGALECLTRHGAASDRVSVFRVPGAFEIPTAVRHIASVRPVDAVITLGALLKGETPHFDFISSQVTLELSRVGTEIGIPVAFGVITCNTMEQAVARTQRGSNKGWEAALAAMEMANLFRAVR
ncbi:MAG TPA: 6,7-dimethyl-8-ribityllumazine synthase [Thermoanaerobaculia bacterium]|nr:6,7-dimethyl-8-ribityllumazine synthase [Thermoanaerobaculia bacterium]